MSNNNILESEFKKIINESGREVWGTVVDFKALVPNTIAREIGNKIDHVQGGEALKQIFSWMETGSNLSACTPDKKNAIKDMAIFITLRIERDLHRVRENVLYLEKLLNTEIGVPTLSETNSAIIKQNFNKYFELTAEYSPLSIISIEAEGKAGVRAEQYMNITLKEK